MEPQEGGYEGTKVYVDTLYRAEAVAICFLSLVHFLLYFLFFFVHFSSCDGSRIYNF